jgi:glycosyltransferase involved in cell wall biosynthesis
VPPAPEGGGGTGDRAPALSLVVPAYNEGDRLEAGVQRLPAAADETGIDLDTVEVLVVDDGSSDDTRACAERLVADLPVGRVVAHRQNLGKGAAVRTGLLAATGRKVAFADADMAIDPIHLPSLLDALDHADVAVGSRAVRGHVDYGSRIRTEAGRAFNLAVRAIGGVRLADTQCGFKGFNRGPALLLSHLQTTAGYAFDVELLWLAARLNLRREVVPVTWLDVPGSSVRPLHDSARMLADLVAARRRPRFLAVAELHGPLESAPPNDAVRVVVDDGVLLCSAVADLGALRRAVGAGHAVRCVRLEALVARVPRSVEPAV